MRKVLPGKVCAPARLMVSLLSIAAVILIACQSDNTRPDPGQGTVTAVLMPGKATELRFPDAGIIIEAPEGAVTSETRITIQHASVDEVPEALKARELAGAIKLEPAGVVFAEPLFLTVELSSENSDTATRGATGENILIAGADGAAVPLANAAVHVDEEGKTLLTSHVPHFSWIVRQKSLLESRLEVVPRQQIVGQEFEVKSEHRFVEASGLYSDLAGISDTMLLNGPLVISPSSSDGLSTEFFLDGDDPSPPAPTRTLQCAAPGLASYIVIVSGWVHVYDLVDPGNSDRDTVNMTFASVVECIAGSQTPSPTPPSAALSTPTPFSGVVATPTFDYTIIPFDHMTMKELLRQQRRYPIGFIPPTPSPTVIPAAPTATAAPATPEQVTATALPSATPGSGYPSALVYGRYVGDALHTLVQGDSCDQFEAEFTRAWTVDITEIPVNYSNPGFHRIVLTDDANVTLVGSIDGIDGEFRTDSTTGVIRLRYYGFFKPAVSDPLLQPPDVISADIVDIRSSECDAQYSVKFVAREFLPR